jgi:hypothetical protein
MASVERCVLRITPTEYFQSPQSVSQPTPPPTHPSPKPVLHLKKMGGAGNLFFPFEDEPIFFFNPEKNSVSRKTKKKNGADVFVHVAGPDSDGGVGGTWGPRHARDCAGLRGCVRGWSWVRCADVGRARGRAAQVRRAWVSVTPPIPSCAAEALD